MLKINNVVLIGAGNLATHLGQALYNAGKDIIQVYNRTLESAKILADKINAENCTNLNSLSDKADLYIISVSDDALVQTVKQLKLYNKFIVHTSGAVSINIFDNTISDFGVFYPLQTFSKDRELDFKTIPVCLEANSKNNLESLKQLALSIASEVYCINSEQRKILHLSAVFACNFPNYLYSIAERLLFKNNIDFDIIKPLILETALKVQTLKPNRAQTGPAMRGDKKIISDHLGLLKEYPEFRDLYQIISRNIKDRNVES